MHFPRSFALMMVALATCLASAPARASGTDDASRYVSGVGDQALAVISDQALAKEQKQAKLERLFAANVDIPWIGRFVLGRFWRQATPDQKTRYLKKYERFLILHYTSRFAGYTKGSFKTTGVRQDGDEEFTVSMEMRSSDAPGDEPVLVDYRVRKDGGNFKIFDVVVEGVSMITTQRSEFNSVLTSHGIDYLIGQLNEKSSAAAADKP